jgi:hypothetical protein
MLEDTVNDRICDPQKAMPIRHGFFARGCDGDPARLTEAESI